MIKGCVIQLDIFEGGCCSLKLSSYTVRKDPKLSGMHNMQVDVAISAPNT